MVAIAVTVRHCERDHVTIIWVEILPLMVMPKTFIFFSISLFFHLPFFFFFILLFAPICLKMVAMLHYVLKILTWKGQIPWESAFGYGKRAELRCLGNSVGV
jgi:hypothetical protein